jgi:hypothetical protein
MNNPLFLILRAIIEYNKGNIKESLELLKQTLLNNPLVNP